MAPSPALAAAFPAAPLAGGAPAPVPAAPPPSFGFHPSRPPSLADAVRLPRTRWWYDRAGPDPTDGFKRSTHALTKDWTALERNKNRPGKRAAIAKSYESHMLQCERAVAGLATAEARAGFLERFGAADVRFLAALAFGPAAVTATAGRRDDAGEWRRRLAVETGDAAGAATAALPPGRPATAAAPRLPQGKVTQEGALGAPPPGPPPVAAGRGARDGAFETDPRSTCKKKQRDRSEKSSI